MSSNADMLWSFNDELIICQMSQILKYRTSDRSRGELTLVPFEAWSHGQDHRPGGYNFTLSVPEVYIVTGRSILMKEWFVPESTCECTYFFAVMCFSQAGSRRVHIKLRFLGSDLHFDLTIFLVTRTNLEKFPTVTWGVMGLHKKERF